jgi:IclR family acetate operon transcriptional repressor
VAQNSHGLTSTGLAQLVGLEKPTAIRLLRTLSNSDYVCQDREKRYFLTAKMLRLAHRSLDATPVAAIARPYLTALRDSTAETVHLAVLERDHVVYIDKLASSQPIQLVSRLGASSPITTTALGKAICATLPHDELEELLDHASFETLTPRSLTTKGDLLDEIAATVARGYAVDNGENEAGVICVSVAIPDPQRVMATPAAISISGPDFRMVKDLPHLGSLCEQTATRIAAALGLTETHRSESASPNGPGRGGRQPLVPFAGYM